MGIMHALLPWIQIVLSLILIISILLQHTSAGVGSAFGGTEGSAIKTTRRGFEKVLFIVTIVIAILFVASSLLVIIL